MSFSAEIKDSIVRSIAKYSKRVEKVVAGVLQSSCAIKITEDGERILYLTSESASLVKMLKIYSDNLISYTGSCKLAKARKGKTRLRYSLTFTNPDDFLMLHGIELVDNEMSLELSKKINHRVQRKKDYVSGFFLGTGSISDPNKSYHLEFLCKSEKQAQDFINLLESLEIKAKCIQRSYFWVVYIKDSEIIADLLSVMGADSERFRFEDAKIIKDLRNKVNRQVNCDTANLDKIADMSSRQIKAIELIKEKMGLDNLSPKLREAAEIRLKEPELGLQELGAMLNPPLGKSGINHRLKRIEKIANALEIEAGK